MPGPGPGSRTPSFYPGTSPAPDDAEPLPPSGRYVPIHHHKDGGMGRIHLALDTELNRHVAFKEIQPTLAHLPQIVRHFLFEAEITGRLEHPGVVPVYGLGRFADGRPHYAMRFIDGQSLAEAIRDFHSGGADTPPADRAVALRRLLARFVAVCQTIGYAHSRGVIHRDLKPHNVMLGPFGETLVVDWGLAKRLSLSGGCQPPEFGVAATRSGAREATDEHPTRTASGSRIGSPGYWAPEQAAGETDRHDERTDVYGLGGVLFHVLTGKAPHPSGDHPPEPPSPRAAAGWVDDVLDGITRTALNADPSARFPSALAVAAEVERWLADQPIAAQWAAVAALVRQAAEHPADPVIAEHLARQHANLGLMLNGMGRNVEAVEQLRAAYELFNRLAEAHRTVTRYRAEAANCLLHLSQAFDALGQPAEAEGERARATAIYDGLLAAHPEEYRANLASVMMTHAGAVGPPRPRLVDDDGSRTHDGESAVLAPSASTGTPGEVTAPSRPPLPEPELLQGYTVQRVLGEGAFGQILLARDNALNRLVAIKDFRADLSDTARVRAVQEMQVTARLIHPNVIRVYTYGMHAGTKRPFLVMEYLPGNTLREEIREFHRDPIRRFTPADPRFVRLVSAVAQACDGIHFAHTQGVLHRDPKPSNIMVQEDGRAVVIDWGLAKVLGAPDPLDQPGGRATITADPTLTVEGAVMGTPAYMAPEQARGVGAGPRTDIYTLGAGLFEVITGRLPYDERDVQGILQQLLVGKARRPRDLNPDVPVELEAICAVAMAFNPDARFPTAAAMAADLRAWLAGLPVSVRDRGRLRRLWDHLTGRG